MSLQKHPKMSIASAANFLSMSTQAVHKQIKNKNIKCKQIGNKSYIDYSDAKILFEIEFRKKNIVAQIVKGGVGKTTSIDYLASCANTYGATVLKIDIDPQGNLTDLSGIDPECVPVLIDVIKDNHPIEDAIINTSPGMDIIPSRIENVVLDNELTNKRLNLKDFFNDLLEPVNHIYDFIFIDCPPTMGQAVTAATLFSDLIVAPLNPEKFSAKGLQILKDELQTLAKSYKKKMHYKVFLNKFSNKTILSDKAIVSLLGDKELEGKVSQTMIPLSQEIPNLSDQGISSFCHIKKSTIRDDFDVLTRELLEIFPAKKITTKNSSKTESSYKS